MMIGEAVKQVTLHVDATDAARLARLAQHFANSRAGTIRLALRRLAEAEGLEPREGPRAAATEQVQ
jgi:hypothetical protein